VVRHELCGVIDEFAATNATVSRTSLPVRTSPHHITFVGLIVKDADAATYVADDGSPHPFTVSALGVCGLEGIVAKRSDSIYEPGRRSGLWSKFRINLGQEFVVGGYTPGRNGFDES
jgi:hypothetical protein